MLEHLRASVNDRIAQLTASAPNVPQTGTGLRLICCWVFVRFRQRPHGERIEYSQEGLAGATLASKGRGRASRGRQGYNPGDPK